MTRSSEWIGRRGQDAAAEAINQMIDLKHDERIQLVPETLIDDSPAQVRDQFEEDSLQDLVTSMADAGFAGALVIRPHPTRTGRFELVFGHRRRAAWRLVCRSQNRECTIPALIRGVTDRDMLVQGATENLARENLSLKEECELVARLIREFYPASQDEVARKIGKTRGWIAPRARVNNLPAELRTLLWQRPSAMSHILLLTDLYQRDSPTALQLAQRIVSDDLPLSTVRALLSEAESARRTPQENSENHHNLTNKHQFVNDVTTSDELVTVREHTRLNRTSVIPEPDAQNEFIDLSSGSAMPDLDDPDVVESSTFDVITTGQERRLGLADDELLVVTPREREHVGRILEHVLAASKEAKALPATTAFDPVRSTLDEALAVLRRLL